MLGVSPPGLNNCYLTFFLLISRTNTWVNKDKGVSHTRRFYSYHDKLFCWRHTLCANTIWLKESAEACAYLRTKILGFLRIIRRKPRMPWPS